MAMYRVEAKNFVAGVEVHDGRITLTAPILRKFLGQAFQNLERWCAKQGFTIEKLWS